jgi:hypothetical protein
MQNHFNKTLIASAIALAGFGVSSAQADAIAYAYNDISNFSISSPVGFTLTTGSTASQSSSQLTGYAADASGVLVDAASSCSGTNCPQPNNGWGIVGPDLAHGDAQIVNPDILGSGQAINEALVNLLGNGDKFGASQGSNSLNGLINMQADGSLVFNMTADPWLYVMTTEIGETADANLDFSISLINELNTNEEYRWTPTELNGGLAQLIPGSKSEGEIGGAVIPLTWTSPLLTAGNWTLNVQMGERANATTIPEPASLALLAGGILGLGFMRRRFKAA